MKSYSCKACGYTGEAEDDAKFCQQCGAKLAGDIALPVPQAGNSVVKRNVVGPIIKDHLLAQLLEGGEKKSGKFEVRTDGVDYITSSRFGNRIIQIPLEDIASVNLGDHDNILLIRRKSGGEMLVKMGGAERWVKMIKQQMA